MATNLEKATEFLSRASLLLDTSKRMEDIFFLTMKKRYYIGQKEKKQNTITHIVERTTETN